MQVRSPIPSVTSASRHEKPIVERLLQLYLHDFSGFAGANDPFGFTDDSGTFQYRHLESYWEETKREPLLFRIHERLAGFALINDWSASGLGTDKAIAEFFVLRKFRRTGLGKLAAIEIIHGTPANWEIAVTEYNQPALLFWRSVVASLNDYTCEEIDGDGQRWCGKVLRIAPV